MGRQGIGKDTRRERRKEVVRDREREIDRKEREREREREKEREREREREREGERKRGGGRERKRERDRETGKGFFLGSLLFCSSPFIDLVFEGRGSGLEQLGQSQTLGAETLLGVGLSLFLV